MVRTLWVTNDFPPRTGGIEAFVSTLVGSLEPARTRVLASDFPGADDHDRALPYRVERVGRRPLLPGPRLRARVRAAVAEHEPDVVVLGSAWPLGELAAAMDRPTLALTHGHEAGLTAAGLGLLVRRSTRHLHAITVISTYTHSRLRRAVGAAVHPLPPGVDTDRFRPDLDGAGFRARHGIGPGDPLVVTVGRLVRRKGQDVLVEAWPCVREQVPGARLLVAGDGPLQRHLERRVERLDLNGSVVLPGTVPADDLPACHAAADVFAMPCRTRLGGLDVEGLGIVYLEAQASGTPVVAGRSGGAPEAVRDGRTGRVVDGRSPPDVADAVVELLGDPDVRSRAGAEGRAFVAAHHAWPVITRRFHALLLELGDADRPRR